MFIWNAIFELGIDMCICWTTYTFFFFNVEDRISFRAEDAFFPVEEGMIIRAVSDIIISDAPLIILFYEIIDGHIAEYPSICIDVGLKDGGT